MKYLIEEHKLSARRSCECLGLSRAAHYRESVRREDRDAEVIAGDEVMTAAFLDRLLHRCHVFNVKGRSFRLRDLERSLKQ